MVTADTGDNGWIDVLQSSDLGRIGTPQLWNRVRATVLNTGLKPRALRDLRLEFLARAAEGDLSGGVPTSIGPGHELFSGEEQAAAASSSATTIWRAHGAIPDCCYRNCSPLEIQLVAGAEPDDDGDIPLYLQGPERDWQTVIDIRSSSPQFTDVVEAKALINEGVYVEAGDTIAELAGGGFLTVPRAGTLTFPDTWIVPSSPGPGGEWKGFKPSEPIAWFHCEVKSLGVNTGAEMTVGDIDAGRVIIRHVKAESRVTQGDRLLTVLSDYGDVVTHVFAASAGIVQDILNVGHRVTSHQKVGSLFLTTSSRGKPTPE